MDNRNLILAIVLSVVIVTGYQFFWQIPHQKQQLAEMQARQALNSGSGTNSGVGAGASTSQGQVNQNSGIVPAPNATPKAGDTANPAATAANPAPPHGQILSRDQALAASPRIRIDTPKISGSIALKGGLVDDVVLKSYRETVAKDSAQIAFLSPIGTLHEYYADFGWTTTQAGVDLPNRDTIWTADSNAVLRPGLNVTLTWQNKDKIIFKRTYEIDSDYMITATQEVVNNSSQKVELYPYVLAAHRDKPQTLGYFILHEGFVGWLNDRLREHKYTDLESANIMPEDSNGGWFGLTDKYFLLALIPTNNENVKTSFRRDTVNNVDHYQIDYLGSVRYVPPGDHLAVSTRIFAGAKEVRLLRKYEQEFGINRFDYAVDWGWFFFLTRPFFRLLDMIFAWVGNFGIAILIMTVLLKILFYPLAGKSYVMMNKMKRLTPQITALREKYPDDKVRLNQEMMALYKTEKVNPVSGCVPMLLQIPVFFSLYKVLFVTIEMRHAPFYGWIHDLSAPDPTTIFNLFGLINWQPPSFLMLGIWPIIMGVTMVAQQRMNPPPADPMQAKIFAYMPYVFTFMLASFPSGLVIYWAWNNALTVLQQYMIGKRHGPPVPPPKMSLGKFGGKKSSAAPASDAEAKP
ncbi:MAG: membrane protein insertase YidC [Candidatus Symbiobacter sp.]|nr:membrane protein insertase YidC [Candidatus Symbiobacter sp.]